MLATAEVTDSPARPTRSTPSHAPGPLTRRELGWAVLLIGLAAGLYLSPALFGGRFLSPADILFQSYPWQAHRPAGWAGSSNELLGDSITYFEPALAYTARRLREGGLPLWNPDNMLGAPFLGNMQSAVFDPLNWPYYLWPGGAMLAVRAWLRIVVAALGAYVLARQVLRVGPAGAAVAAVTYGWGAFLTVWLLYALAGVAIWLPWLWWATARLVERPRPRQVAALAAFVALSLVAGHPETAYHIALATGLFLLFAVSQIRPWRAGQAAGRLGLWAAAYGLGALVAAIQLLPFAEYVTQSTALALRTDPHWAGFSLPFAFAWTLIGPDFFGNPAHDNWWAQGVTFNYNEINGYAGIVPLVLAPLALLSPRRSGGAGLHRWRMALFLFGLIALAAGVVYRAPVVYEAVTAFPLLRSAANHRLLLVVEFALALLAALGTETLAQRLRGGRRRAAWVLAGTFFVLLGAGVGVPWLLARSYFQLPVGYAPANAVWQESLIRTAALLLVAGGLPAAALILARRRPRWGRVALTLLPLLALADLWQAHGDYNPTIAPADYYPPTQVTTFLQEQPAPYRTVRLVLPNINLVYDFSSLLGYDAVEPRTYSELVTFIDPQIPRNNRRHFSTQDTLQSRIWNLLGVRYVLAPPGGDPNYLPDIRQEASGAQTVGEIFGANRPGQTFTATHNNLAQIQVLGAVYGGHARGRLVFHLKTSPTAPTDLVTQALDAAQLPDNSYWTISFPPIRETQGRQFYFYFDAPDAQPGQAATLWHSDADAYPAGTRTADGQPAPGDLAFRTFSVFDPDGPWLTPVAEDTVGDAAVFANQKALPRAWLTHAVEVQPDSDARIRRLYDSRLDWRTTAVLAAPLAPEQVLPAAPPLAGIEAVTITHYAPEAVEIEARSPAPGVLVLADQASPGWAAQVDGQPAPILTVDHALRGVYLPAGAHTISFAYAPASFRWGTALTGVGLLVLGLLTLWPMRIAPQRRGDTELGGRGDG